MPKRHLLFIVVFMIFSQASFAWEPGYMLGGKAAGLANCGLSSKDVWSVSNNPAMMPLNEKSSFGVVGQNRFGLSNLNAGAIATNIISKRASVGFYLNSLGNSAYNQYSTGLSFSKKLASNFSMGITLFYSGISVQEYGNFGAPGVNLGFAFPFSDNFIGSFKVNNPTRSRISEIADERMQASTALGISHKLSKLTSFYVEAEVFEFYPMDFRSGFEYYPNDNYSVRFGFSTLRQSVCFGLGFEKGLKVLIGLSYHNRLGFSSTFDTQLFFGNAQEN